MASTAGIGVRDWHRLGRLLAAHVGVVFAGQATEQVAGDIVVVVDEVVITGAAGRRAEQ